MWDLIHLYIADVSLILGSFLSLSLGLGLIRFPDFYSRMHAAGVADTLCAALIIFGLSLYSGFNLVTLKLYLILLFIWFTSPTSSFTLANTAYRSGYDVDKTSEEESSSKS